MPFPQRNVGPGGDPRPDAVGVRGHGRGPAIPGPARGDLPGLAAALLEPANPGRTDGVPGGDAPGREAAIHVGQGAGAEVGGVGSGHGISSG